MKNEEKMIQLLEGMRGLSGGPTLFKNSDLTFSQFALLASVGRMPGCRANDVAVKLGLSAPTVSVALNKLEGGGWLQRATDPEDARAAQVELTAKGYQFMKVMREHRKARISTFLSALDGNEQTQLLGLLEKASKNIEIREK